jgi:hypothetical protein
MDRHVVTGVLSKGFNLPPTVFIRVSSSPAGKHSQGEKGRAADPGYSSDSASGGEQNRTFL